MKVTIKQPEPRSDDHWQAVISYADMVLADGQSRTSRATHRFPCNPAQWRAVREAVELHFLEAQQKRAEWLEGFVS